MSIRPSPQSALCLALALGLGMAFAGDLTSAHAQVAQPQPTPGPDQVSAGPDVDALREKFDRLWSPNCGAPGAESVQLGVRIRLKPDGDTAGPVLIENPHWNDPVWRAAAARAAVAAKAAPYHDLTPAQLRSLAARGVIHFRIDQSAACRL